MKKFKCLHHLITFFQSIRTDGKTYRIKKIKSNEKCNADNCMNNANIEVVW